MPKFPNLSDWKNNLFSQKKEKKYTPIDVYLFCILKKIFFLIKKL